ncbi:MAG: amidohydrolase [Deltaproteobacteria bacterium]|nr:amidohydrolase [Deltaproteobacteria bacterium]
MPNPKECKETGSSWVNAHKLELIELSQKIWEFPELGLEEHRSSKLLMDFLGKQRFTVMKEAAGIPTAFVAAWGSGRPVIGINCEYDALPGLSQEMLPRKQPRVAGAPGHGCGHNLLGVGAVGAAAALAYLMKKHKLPGTIKVLGTPAEEICAGKPFMASVGLFKGFDAIIDWHPYFLNQVLYDTCNAYFNVKYHFQGRTAHGNSPWEGRSALDAAILMGHAIELMREHIPPGEPTAANTMNYSFSDVGPEYPNVVPDRSTLWGVGRFQTSVQMEPVLAQLKKCAEGAALATETKVTQEFITATHEKIPNAVLSGVMHRNLVALGTPSYSAEEEKFARNLQRSYGSPEIGMDRQIQPLGPGSTGVSDNSEFSWFAPFVMAWIACAPPGVSWHNWLVNASCRAGIGQKGMILAAQLLTATGVDLLLNGKLIQEAKAELQKRIGGRKYRPIFPAGTPVPLKINRETMGKYRPLLDEKIAKREKRK